MADEILNPGSEQELSEITNLIDGISPEEIEKAKQQETVSVKPEGVDYVELEVQDFLFAAKMFYEKKTSASDVLSRAVLMEFDRVDKRVKLQASDGLMGMCSSFFYQDITQNFPTSVIIDLETLYRIAQLRSKKLYLVFQNGDFFVDFYGGRVFVPVYSIKSEVLKYKPLSGGEQTKVLPETLLSLIQTAGVYLCSVSVSDLAFVNITKKSAFMANGFSVLKVIGDYVDLKVRKVDLPMVTAAVQQALKSELTVVKTPEKVAFSSASVDLQIPFVDFNFSDSYVKVVNVLPEQFYQVDFSMLYVMLALLDKTFQSSGMVSFISKDSTLMLESLTRAGKKSYMNLTKSAVPVSDFGFLVNIKSLLSVLRVLKYVNVVKLGVAGNVLYLFSDDKVLAIFGKGN